MTVRKNISINEEDYEVISAFAIKNGYTFSELVRTATLNLIKKEEELELAEFLDLHLKEVSQEEQKEIDSLNIDFDDITGKELTLDEIL